MTFPRAVAVSLAVHVVLLLLLMLLPDSPPVARADDEIAVRFDLTEPVPEPPPSSELFRPANPVEERPTDEPVQPAPSSAGAVVPQAAPALPAPTASEPDVAPERPEDEAPSEDAPEPEEPRDATDRQTDEGVALEGDRPTLRDGQESAPAEELDLDRAIREFRPRPTPPPQQPQEQADPGVEDGLAVPELERLPVTGFGMDRNLVFESADYDWSDYSRQIYVAIWRAWHRRLWQTTASFERWAYDTRSEFLEHQVVVQFTIRRNGQVKDIFVVHDSVCRPLDASATDALAEVILPRLPDDFPRDAERVRARFIATGEIRNMKRVLDWMKSAGWF